MVEGPLLGVSALSTAEAGATPQLDIVRGVCVIHAERALRRHKQHFGNFSDKLVDQMRADIEAMKAFPFGKLERHVISLMLTKWSSTRSGYGEKQVAKVWAEGWAHDEFHLMRTALCPSGGLVTQRQVACRVVE